MLFKLFSHLRQPKALFNVFLLVLSLAVLEVQSDELKGGEEALEEIVVYGRSLQQIGIASSASEGVVGYKDIQLPPMLRVGELVEAVPGMVATQHSGTGKANQYFLRGFNLDHGTDFSASLNGVPLNMRSHGHGQGYLDLNPLIPELVEMTYYQKGPYSLENGDFSSAGSVEFDYYSKIVQPSVEVTFGEEKFRRILATGSLGEFVGAFDLTRYAGPWVIDEDLRQDKFHLSWSAVSDERELVVSLDYYDSSWNATDQIPSRIVESGLIDKLGFVDPDLGGSASRLAVSARAQNDNGYAQLYLVETDFSLFSNFTYALDDPFDGDEFEQEDQRLIYGVNLGYEYRLNDSAELIWGVEIRHDDIRRLGLYESISRVRSETIRSDVVSQTSYAAFTGFDWQASERMRVSLGVRADQYRYDVEAKQTLNSGSGSDSQVSPKLKLAYLIRDDLEGYLNLGRGMHSNDVRGASIGVDPKTNESVDQVPLLVPTEGAEVGLRFEKGRRFNASLVYFLLEVDSELVFIGDGGATEPSDRSTRRGIELNAFYRPLDWLSVNASYTYSRSRFDDVDSRLDRIPGSVPRTLGAGITMTSSSGFSASLRFRHLGAAPLTEDNSVNSDSSLLVNAAFGYERGALGIQLEVFNLTDSDDRDIAYYYESRLPGEPIEGISDIHYHPLEPRAVRLSLKRRF